MANGWLDPAAELSDRLSHLQVSPNESQKRAGTSAWPVKKEDANVRVDRRPAQPSSDSEAPARNIEPRDSDDEHSTSDFEELLRPSDADLEVLRKTSPEKQAEAVNILMEEEAAVYARKATLSPHALRSEGHVQYDLKVESVSAGALPTMRVVRLRASRPSPGKKMLSAGVYVLIIAQNDDPKDKKPRKPQTSLSAHARGMIATVGPDFFDLVIEKADEKLLPQGLVQIEGSEMLQVYKRMLSTISEYRTAEGKTTDASPLLLDIVRGRGSVKVASKPLFDPVNLNSSQRRAMQYALGSNVCLIKGPPGTGKTVVLYQTILELLRQGETVLICCGSHTAVDNLIERLDRHSSLYPIARLGHPHRISESTRHNSVDVRRSTAVRGGPRSPPPKVIAATLHAASDLSSYQPIKTIVIDEVCQSLQAQCWIPLLTNKLASRLIIAGDDKQLPPTITTQDKNAAETLDVSLFDVLLGCYGKKVMHLLDTQYRMSEPIMRFSSDYMYEGLLKAATNVASQKLYHVPRVVRGPLTSASIIWIDTSPLGYTEDAGQRGLISNPAEAELVKNHCLKLQGQGVQLSDIGIISPYVHQKNLIQGMLPTVNVNTIDGFQGQERNVIVLSLVRSNGIASVGFLSDERRLNVAITRAKYQLCVVADMKTLERCKSPMLNAWVAWCKSNAKIIRAGSAENI